MANEIPRFTPDLALLPGLLEARNRLDQLISQILMQNGLHSTPVPPVPVAAPPARPIPGNLFPNEIPAISPEIHSADRLSPEGRRKIQEAQRRRWNRARGQGAGAPPDGDE